jgi:ABC-type Fe3+ transport system substrate-binding protein
VIGRHFTGFFAGVLLSLAPAARAEPEVVLLSPHWQGIRHETSLAFSAWHREKYGEPVTLRWRDLGGGTSQMLRFIRSEFARNPEGIGIDVFYGGGVDPYLDLKAAGLLQRYDPPAGLLDSIPENIAGIPLYDPEREWFGAALSGFGILTNEKIRARLGLPEAKTWADLADPRLRGWVSSADPRQSGSVLVMYELILQAYGWERGWNILAGLSGNLRSFLKNGGAPPKEASLGEVAYALAIDVYGWTQVAYGGKDAMTFVLPEGVTTINPDSIALLKNPPNRLYAERFLEFVLSSAGQKLWMLPRGAPGGAVKFDINRMAIDPRLYSSLTAVSPIQANPFTARFDFHYSPEIGVKRRGALSSLLGAVFVDLHPLCRKAWEAVLASPRRDELLPRFLAPPMPEAALLRVAAEEWKNPELRNRRVNEWQRDAAALYRNLIAESNRL